MKMYGGTDPWIHMLGTRWRQVVSFMLLLLYLWVGRVCGSCWIGGWQGPRPSLNMVAKRRSSFPAVARNQILTVQPITQLL